ncbi:unnamed protein product [Protopolystoma xenopodis]|uniref:Uncharacterized protein n=1 Tax=Protopolystoma xenopodis TaxID=117903 RepID=A0A3S5AQM2_9PLAT|nr:unnamed protein product [Protopolystoma xenopodis]
MPTPNRPVPSRLPPHPHEEWDRAGGIDRFRCDYVSSYQNLFQMHVDLRGEYMFAACLDDHICTRSLSLSLYPSAPMTLLATCLSLCVFACMLVWWRGEFGVNLLEAFQFESR